MFLIAELAFTLQSIAVSCLKERTSHIMKNMLKSPMQTSICDIRQISSGSPSICSFISYSHDVNCLEMCSLEYNSHLTTKPFSPVSPKPIQKVLLLLHTIVVNLATTADQFQSHHSRTISEVSFTVTK